MAFDVRAPKGRRRVVAWLAVGLLAAYALLWVLVGTGWDPLQDLDHEVANSAYDTVHGNTGFIGLLEAVDVDRLAVHGARGAAGGGGVGAVAPAAGGGGVPHRGGGDRAGAGAVVQDAGGPGPPVLVRPADHDRRLLVPVRSRRRCGAAPCRGRAAHPRDRAAAAAALRAGRAVGAARAADRAGPDPARRALHQRRARGLAARRGSDARRRGAAGPLDRRGDRAGSHHHRRTSDRPGGGAQPEEGQRPGGVPQPRRGERAAARLGQAALVRDDPGRRRDRR